MIGRTHLAAGILCGEAMVLFQNATNVSDAAFIVAAAAVGSLLPDIDHPRSMLANSSRTTKTVSGVVSSVTQHRGFTHTLAFAGLMWFLATRLAAQFDVVSNDIVISFMLGLLSHLAIDTLNERGVMWFWPIYCKHLHLLRIRTGSAVEWIFRLALNIAATCGIAMILQQLHP